MNWMTSAKNRVQSKRKKHDSLRLVAYSKLLPHSFDSKSSTTQSTIGSQMRRTSDGANAPPQQSKDGMIIASFSTHKVIVVLLTCPCTISYTVFLLANSSRKRKVIADHPLTHRSHTETDCHRTTKLSPKDKDHLKELELSVGTLLLVLYELYSFTGNC